MKWWQLRTTEFALGIYAVVIQRILFMAIFALFAVHQDAAIQQSRPAFYIEDFLFWDIPAYFSALFILCWVFLIVSAVSALAERCYGRIKFVVVFGALPAFLYVSQKTTFETMAILTGSSP
ncbi:MAG: hypothetical protein ACSHX3_00630 [Litorimonas sp.]